jgi:hypothetical protein
MTSSVETALQDIRQIKSDCLMLLGQMRDMCPVNAEGHHPDTFRLVAIPMIYAVWERCFTLCHAIALRRLRDLKKQTSLLDARQRALWLQRQPFYQSYIDRLRQPEAYNAEKKPKKGSFFALCDFLGEFESWSSKEIDKTVATDDLVMSFSNVNPDVVELNAVVLGISESQAFQEIEFGRLHDLVLRRNEIGHGGIVTPPGHKEFAELWAFTEGLIKSYCDAFDEWIAIKLRDPPVAPVT